MNIVFFATPDISINSFKYFINSADYNVQALVTQPTRAQNRGKKIVERNIAKIAKENSIPVLEPEKISKEPEIIAQLKALEPDFFITFAFGQILSQEVIDIPRFATINLHASLLPEYRGANPIAQAIIDGKPYSGITTMKTVLALDAGDICLQEKIEITPEMNVIELMDKISCSSPALLDKTLKGLYEGSLKPIAQEEKLATFTKKMKKEEKEIDWNKDAISLHNKIRGMYKINTNHTTYNNKIVKILKTAVVDCDFSAQNGEVVEIDKEGIIVQCANKALKLITVKPEGKGEMRALDWMRGARIEKGAIFK